MIFVMREVNLAGVDLNLLPALEALIRRRNVTRAGEDVGLSQPAMSRALGRLRELIDDLFLVLVFGGLLRPAAFDAAARDRDFRIAATDVHALLFGPPLLARLRALAPRATLQF